MKREIHPTAPDIEAIRARAEAATKGPWINETQPSDTGGEYATGHVVSRHHTYAGNSAPRTRRNSVTSPDTMTFADGEFIAHARTDIPLLLAALQGSQERVSTERENVLAEVARERGEYIERALRAEARVKELEAERDALLHTSDKQAAAWKARALNAERERDAENSAFREEWRSRWKERTERAEAALKETRESLRGVVAELEESPDAWCHYCQDTGEGEPQASCARVPDCQAMLNRKYAAIERANAALSADKGDDRG